MTARLDDEGPAHDADDDGGRPVEHVGDESHQKAQPPRPVFGEVHPGPDTDGHADQCGKTDDDACSHDSVGDTATGLSCWYRALGEERPIDGRRTLCQEVAENQHQRENGAERQQDDQGGHQPAGEVAPQRAPRHSALLPTAAPRATRQIRSRAMAFTATVSTKRMNPTSNNADRYMLVVASLNSFAIAAAMV